jgi:hypothetical protein
MGKQVDDDEDLRELMKENGIDDLQPSQYY